MHRIRNRYLLLLDALLLAGSTFLIYALRLERLHWPHVDLTTAIIFTAFMVPIRLGIYAVVGLYRRLWVYASITELKLIFAADATASAICFVLGAVGLPALGITPNRVPLSVLFTGALLSVAIVAIPRLLIRIGGSQTQTRRTTRGGDRRSERRVLIVGAGAAGHMLLRELRTNPHLALRPIGFIDDDVMKHGMQLSGLPIFGPLSMTAEIIRREQVDMVVVAMPSAPGTAVRPVVRAALDAGIQARTIPALAEIVAGRVTVGSLREVQIQDLLRREPIETDLARVSGLITDRVVLVTGAGGSIGSELCRQIAQLSPGKLLLLGHGENPIFEILHELRPQYPDLSIIPVIADIRDQRRVREIFAHHNPFSVFHAAAHKHVPLMEENVIEAVTNNVLGTKNIVDAAVEHDTTHFVLISTDKAVRPTNVMGATKRVAEHVVQEAAMTHRKNFVAVRFGNVLGSRGSVVPTFVRQIKEGGPVTVTHPEMRRYFMTIPEAVQLVLQAGALGRGGELFMLDMGELVRVLDLARDLIRLSGLEEGQDIEIRFTGIRPGEKLYEEMFFSDETAVPTEHPKVLRARRQSLETWGSHLIQQLIGAAQDGASDNDLRHMLKAIVPDFGPTKSDVPEIDNTPTTAILTAIPAPQTAGGGRRISR